MKPQFKSYFQQHTDEFAVPEALIIWRIEVSRADEAEEIATSCQGADGVARWKTLVERHTPPRPALDAGLGRLRTPRWQHR